MEPLTATFHNAITDETIVRELTAEEIALIEQSQKDAPDALAD